jgi:DNA-binding NarL/FixJ family response regulator
VVRIVLAEIGSPGPLHYLIEAEGFQVVGCASNDAELARVLAHVEPDVVVLDADVSATSALVAREEAPSSELIVLWPEGVQLPAGAERVHPRLVYQDLGPAIRQAAADRRNRHPVVVEPDDHDLSAPAAPPRSAVDSPSPAAQRTSTRVLVGTAALIALIVMTMGVSFALEGRTGAPQPTDTRSTEISPSAPAGQGRGPGATATSTPSRTGNARPSADTRCVPGAKTDHAAPNEHAAAAARDAHQACAGNARGSAHSAHQHVNGRGNGPTTGAGNPNAKGAGTAKGGGTANAKSSTAPGRSQDHPSGPPATPGGARNGPPG